MLYNIDISKILFLDIETVPQYESFDKLDDKKKELWEKKASYLIKNEEETPEKIYQRAGIYAEFGKIICISTGFIKIENGEKHFRIKSFFGHDEKKLLTEFAELLYRYSQKSDNLLCGHNAKEFDYPYIARRMVINGIIIPEILNLAGKKPWEVNLLDTMELWKFGDYKSYTSLDLLTHILEIPTPKDDIDGSEVADVYYKEKDLKRIVKYCEKDVLATASIFLRYKNEKLINKENIQSLTKFED